MYLCQRFFFQRHFLFLSNTIRQEQVLICSPLVIRVTRGQPWSIASFRRLFFPLLTFSHCILYQQSPNPSIYCSIVLNSPPTLSRSLITQSSHFILGRPRLPFLSIFWASGLFVKLLSFPFLSKCSAHFSPLLTNYTSKQMHSITKPLFIDIIIMVMKCTSKHCRFFLNQLLDISDVELFLLLNPIRYL